MQFRSQPLSTCLTMLLAMFFALPSCASLSSNSTANPDAASASGQPTPTESIAQNSSTNSCDTLTSPIKAGYGARGSYAVTSTTFPHPSFSGEKVSVFYPANRSKPLPVIFFSHAFRATSPRVYEELINHIASKGYIVVFSPYSPQQNTIEQKYNQLWSGFEAAVARYGNLMDLTQVGFVGHSFGAGATPAMAYKGLVNKKWGSRGSFMYIMAPWFSFQITPEQLQNYPRNTKLLVQVYQDDTINDHRMGINLFRQIQLPPSEKNYVMLQSDTYRSCQLVANHPVPNTYGRDGKKVNALDYYGVYRLFDALADYAFNGNPKGKEIALGQGNKEQIFMGTWPDGTPVRPLIATQNPQPAKSESSYQYPISQQSRYSATSTTGSAAPSGISAPRTNSPLPTQPCGPIRRRLGRC